MLLIKCSFLRPEEKNPKPQAFSHYIRNRCCWAEPWCADSVVRTEPLASAGQCWPQCAHRTSSITPGHGWYSGLGSSVSGGVCGCMWAFRRHASTHTVHTMLVSIYEIVHTCRVCTLLGMMLGGSNDCDHVSVCVGGHTVLVSEEPTGVIQSLPTVLSQSLEAFHPTPSLPIPSSFFIKMARRDTLSPKWKETWRSWEGTHTAVGHRAPLPSQSSPSSLSPKGDMPG